MKLIGKDRWARILNIDENLFILADKFREENRRQNDYLQTYLGDLYLINNRAVFQFKWGRK